MTIEFINHQEWGIDLKPFDPLIERLKEHVPFEQDGILNVIFVNDTYIQALNKAYRKIDAPTDVLSFNYQTDGHFSNLIGEIYISVDTAQKQAEAFHHSFSDELNKLFVHGFLHIHGHDHEYDEDYKMMHAIECEVLGGEI